MAYSSCSWEFVFSPLGYLHCTLIAKGISWCPGVNLVGPLSAEYCPPVVDVFTAVPFGLFKEEISSTKGKQDFSTSFQKEGK